MKIESPENTKVKMWEKLKQKKYRDEYGLFIVQGAHMVEEAMKGGFIDTLLVRDGVENRFPSDCVYVSDKVMKKLSENTSLNDYLAICNIPENKNITGKRFIVLENVQDPGNVGTIIRTAYSFGYDAVFLNEGCASLYNSKTIQSSQGSIFHMPVITMPVQDIFDYLNRKGIRKYVTFLHTDTYLSKVNPCEKYALVFGNEGKGVSQYVLDNSDETFKIEMDRFESLNVASAMSICAYYFRYNS